MRTYLLRGVFFLFFIASLPVLFAQEARIALVVGNAQYGGEASLKNPVNDATDIAAGLEKIGWKVIKITNVTRRDFNRAIDEFNTQLEANPGASALFYYAGHGIQFGGSNYLVPVKVEMETESDVRSEAIDLQSITDVMKTQKVNIALVILDACRDNPFTKGKTRSGAGPTRGLSSTVPNKVGAKGMAVMFATGPGDVAQDGTGRNGLFTQAFLKYLDTDLRIDDVFKKISQDVKETSKLAQTPWMNSSISDDFYLVPEAKRKKAAASSTETPLAAATTAVSGAALRGKAKFQSLVEGEIYLGDELLGAVGPDSDLLADSLATGKQEFVLKVDGTVVESRVLTVTDKAYTSVLFGKKLAPASHDPAATPAPGSSQAPQEVISPAPVQAIAAKDPASAPESNLANSSVVATAREKFKGKYVLKVEGPVAGMRVLLNGETVGMTPLSMEIPVENAVVEVAHADFEPWQQKIYPTKNEELFLKVNTGRSQSFKRNEAIQEYTAIEALLKRTKNDQEFPKTMAGIGWLSMLGGVAVGTYGWVTGYSLLGQYNSATDPDVISNLRSQIESSDDFIKGGIITAAGGLLGALFFEILVPDTKPIQKKLSDSYQQVMNLGGFDAE